MDGKDDTNSIKPTRLDIERLKNAKEGDSIDGELGNWRVLIYKDSYVVLLHNSSTKNSFNDFISLDKALDFLNS